MPRSGRIRRYIQEMAASPRAEKLSFIPPFIILAIEVILLSHAVHLNEGYVILLTAFLLIVSVIELIFVITEIHEHQRWRILTIKLDDFITKGKKNNVKEIVSEFVEKYPEYEKQRSDIYRLSCQILDTHREEDIEEEITKKLKAFIKKNDKRNVDDIIEAFLHQYPSFKNHRVEIYHKTCHILGRTRAYDQ